MTAQDERTAPSDPLDVSDVASLARAVLARVATVVVGLDRPMTLAMAAVLARGHVLVEDVPGLGKTLAARTLAEVLGLGFRRLQCTPDLLPADVTGSFVYSPTTGTFDFHAGPVFTGILLADEINRATPKTQSALLEAMQEAQVTVEGRTFQLPVPFLLFATSNPIEYEGTFPLPEAQLDRFLLKLTMSLPQREDEVQVLDRHANGFDPRDLDGAGVRRVLAPGDLTRAQEAVRSVRIGRDVMGYIVDLSRATRVSPSLSLGVSPRGSTALLNTSRAWAWLTGRDYVTPDDVKAMARATLRHRVQLRPEAELEGTTVEAVLESVLQTTAVPR